MNKIIRLNEQDLNNIIRDVLTEGFMGNPQQNPANNTLTQMQEVYNLAKQYGLEDIANFVNQRITQLKNVQQGGQQPRIN